VPLADLLLADLLLADHGAWGEISRYDEQLSNRRRVRHRSALVAFQSLDALVVSRGNPRKVANEIGVPPQKSVVFLDRLRQALHVRREQLSTLRQSFLFFG